MQTDRSTRTAPQIVRVGARLFAPPWTCTSLVSIATEGVDLLGDEGRRRCGFITSGVPLLLVDAKQARALPGEKTDRKRSSKTPNIRLGSVLSDVFGASGQRLLEALLAGQSLDLAEVVRLTHWRLPPKVEQIQRALDGHLTDHHRFVIECGLDHVRYIERQIVRLDDRIAQYLAPHAQAHALLQTIPGLAQTSASTVLAPKSGRT